MNPDEGTTPQTTTRAIPLGTLTLKVNLRLHFHAPGTNRR